MAATEAELAVLEGEVERQQALADAWRNLPKAVDQPVWGATARGQLQTEGTYRPDTRTGFFRDIVFSRNDPAAQERLSRNQAEALEHRDLTTADPGAAGFVPPIYLGQQWAELARPSRPFANIVPQLPFPDTGTQVSVPKVQSGVVGGGTDGREHQRLRDGHRDREPSHDRWTQRRVAPVVGVVVPRLGHGDLNDLLAAHDQQLDTQLLSGTGTSGQHLGLRSVAGINTVTYTAGTPSGAGLRPKVYDAIQQVATNRYMPDLFLMEGPVQFVRFDDVLSQSLTVRLRLHSFSFYVPHRQPKSIAVVTGPGLAAPSFA